MVELTDMLNKKILIGFFIIMILCFSTSTYAQYSNPVVSEGLIDYIPTKNEITKRYKYTSPDLQQKINAIGNTPAKSVSLPVLFGVSLEDMNPNFGVPRSSGRTHEGQDIMAPVGTPVVSPTPAVVIKITTGVSEGNAVYTINPGGETFVYIHLDRFAEGLTEGSVLESGSLIGYVGNTGNASGGAAHLHFEIRDSSYLPLDPFPRISSEFSDLEKMTYLTAILNQSNEKLKLAQFLAMNFSKTFISIQSNAITIPVEIINYLPPAPVVIFQTINRTLKLGSTGDDVKTLQSMLGGLVPDGSFGHRTRDAVVSFQKANNLIADGVYGPRSQAVLGTGTQTTLSSLPAGCISTTAYSPLTGIKCR